MSRGIISSSAKLFTANPKTSKTAKGQALSLAVGAKWRKTVRRRDLPATVQIVIKEGGKAKEE
jgi:hypothetical protein